MVFVGEALGTERNMGLGTLLHLPQTLHQVKLHLPQPLPQAGLCPWLSGECDLSLGPSPLRTLIYSHSPTFPSLVS